jgi:thiol-disulfide isomerase/thioredoxin
MPITPSNPIQSGWTAPNFKLPEPLTGQFIALEDFKHSKAVLIAFFSNVCPFVKHIENAFNKFAKEYEDKGLKVIAINANASEIKAEETAKGVTKSAREGNYVFPYLYDESQQVAAAFDATCTPDLFLLDSGRKLFYRGQFDDSRPDNGIEVNGHDLRAAVDDLLAGRPAPTYQKHSIGCNIKWRDGDDHGVRQPAEKVAA